MKLAEALGCVGLRCDSATDVDATIEKAMAINDQPVVIDFIVGEDAMVWPMVAAGTSNDEIKIARDTAPDFDYEMGEVVAGRADDLLPEAARPAEGSELTMSPPHPVRAGREQARRARPRRQPVQPPRLQHRLARGRSRPSTTTSAASRWSRASRVTPSSSSPSSSTSSSTSSRSSSWRRPRACSASCCW